MTTNDSVIIFHRSRQNSEEDLINQQTFLEAHKEYLGSVKVIDYMSNDYRHASEIFKITRRCNKFAVIINSFLSKQEYDLQYNLHHYFQSLKTIGIASVYLMDSEGRLYKETEMIEIL